ncbi:hypothetical protein J4423_02285 [Candidatus Pacearchaeota archaeon]|nr:hypothetical protein [Candidatus Pacearchaeota archaeon]
MSKLKTAWECECGSIAYGKLPPEECARCSSSDCFIEADEEKFESLADENLMEEIRAKDWGED